MMASRSPCCERGQLAIARQEVAGLADRADDVGHDGRAGSASVTGQIGVIRVVKRGPDEVVHGRVDDDEVLDLAVLEVEHLRQEDTGVADDDAARLADAR